MIDRYQIAHIAILCLFALTGCKDGRPDTSISADPIIPRGYQKSLEIQIGDQVLTFGPFVGYYFKPANVPDTSRLDFLCFNENDFYTRDLEPNMLLYRGTAVLRVLNGQTRPIPRTDDRIVPVFFSDAPDQWLKSRPEPQQRFVHFHSAYNAHGAVFAGFWLTHVAEKTFTYDMGGRVGPDSPLYHDVKPGPDLDFARIIEFDHGP